MIHIEFASPLPKEISQKRMEAALKQFTKALRIRSDVRVGLAFVRADRIRQLNRVYRAKDKATDVLSFAPEAVELPPKVKKEQRGYLGDIMICPSYARKEAKRRGVDFEEELIRLFVHGLLHLKGYNHRTEQEELTMFALQEKIIEATVN